MSLEFNVPCGAGVFWLFQTSAPFGVVQLIICTVTLFGVFGVIHSAALHVTLCLVTSVFKRCLCRIDDQLLVPTVLFKVGVWVLGRTRSRVLGVGLVTPWPCGSFPTC